ncbi:ATP-binding protein [Streptomyces sp. NPDC093111]|uniref:ATP-binding protein n=1 Tax=Streptomyces sp. NPDC093111 TaxID=3154978 RepID=UPI00342845D8
MRVPVVRNAPPRIESLVTSTDAGPGAVRKATEAAAGILAKVGIPRRSAFADAVLLVVGELVANVVRHARETPVVDVGITVGGGGLVVSVADGDPRMPELDPTRTRSGLWSVTEVAAVYDGEMSVEPALQHAGKVVLVTFRIPAQQGGTTENDQRWTSGEDMPRT